MQRSSTSKLISYFLITVMLLISAVVTDAQTRPRNPEGGKKKAAKRIGIGAAIGAGAGGLIGGRKGALIGAGVGAGGGTAYHYNKKRKWRKKYRRSRLSRAR